MDEQRKSDLMALQAKLGIYIRDLNLLDVALTHPSWEEGESSRRLELVGDAALTLAIKDALFHLPSQLTVHEMSVMHSKLVCNEALEVVGNRLGLSSLIKVRVYASRKKSLVADALEAIIGAYFKEQGYECAAHLVINLFSEEFKKVQRDMAPIKMLSEESARSQDPNFRELLVEASSRKLGMTTVFSVKWTYRKRCVAHVYIGGCFVTSAEGINEDLAINAVSKKVLENRGWLNSS